MLAARLEALANLEGPRDRQPLETLRINPINPRTPPPRPLPPNRGQELRPYAQGVVAAAPKPGQRDR